MRLFFPFPLSPVVPPRSSSNERGQAIVLVAAVGFVLMGMLAVVVDSGYLYTRQRQMQSAVDAAALAGAQNWLAGGQQLDLAAGVADARSYATYNGYTNTIAAPNGTWDPSSYNGVFVSIPPSTGTYSNNVQYVEVIISQPIQTFFAGIFNVNSVQVTTRAVARGMAGSLNASIIALSGDDDALTTSGSSTTYVYGNVYSAGGIKCNSGNITVYQGAAYAVDSFGPNCLSGQLQAEGGLQSNPPRIYDPQWPSSESLAPPGPGGNWSSAGQVAEEDGYVHLPAGTYNSITVRPGDYVKFDGGVYHLMGAGDSPALDIEGNVASAAALQFVLEGGAVHFEAQASGSLSSGPAYNNILIYSKRTDGGTAIQITGGASLTYNGTIYAPGGTVAISGNSSANINGQVVANEVTLSGNSGTAIQWDSTMAPIVVSPVLVE